MNPNMQHGFDPRLFSRSGFLQLLAASREVKSFRFARQAAINWLAVFPGDLAVQVELGKAHFAEGRNSQAIAVLERVCRFDPEFLPAQELLAQVLGKINPEKASLANAAALLLGSKVSSDRDVPIWYAQHLAARLAICSGNLHEAEANLLKVVEAAPEFPLAGIDYLASASKHSDSAALFTLANQFHGQWPDCLQFSLQLAELEMEFGNENHAVELLHQCVSNDAAGQVTARLWGSDHRYQPLWPGGLEIFLDIPVPAEVAGALGWNQLATGALPAAPAQPGPIPPTRSAPPAPMKNQPAQPPKIQAVEPPARGPVSSQGDEALIAVEASFSKLAKKLKQPALGRTDGRFPVYVIFSTRMGLDAQYGPQTREVLQKEMALLAEQVSHRPGWGAMAFLPDDPEMVERLGLKKAVDALDPWKLKLSLADLDQALAKKGQMIGAVLIVGGAEVVPFHLLPNPTYDNDKDVPSDNPYSTLDSNYFIPEWPVGRLPGEAGEDAGLLLAQLRSMSLAHAKRAKLLPELGGILAWLLEFLRQRTAGRSVKGLGYTASVWKESSNQVMRAMSDGGSMLVCPPETRSSISNEQFLSAPLEYFNLHGLPDAAEWYGQKDATDFTNEPDYPVAIGPKNLVKNGKAPQLVFSEACYGAHIDQKHEDESLALKFLSIGTKAFIGSTVIAYGSVTAPLIGADLLGSYFWKYSRSGMTAGEALFQAKISVVREMNQRQGFLDGEDQKTLISFVLYGDPLSGYDAARTKNKAILRFKGHPKVKTICDRHVETGESAQVPEAVMKEVKGVVARYLPGLEEAEIQISSLHEVCAGQDHHCPTSEMGPKAAETHNPAGTVVTLSKSVGVARKTFRQYARVTLNAKGKLVKLAVSR